MRSLGCIPDVEKEVAVHYKRHKVGSHRLDLLVERRAIIGLKTVEKIGKSHYAQVRSYMRATGVRHALLVNFGQERADVRRVDWK